MQAQSLDDRSTKLIVALLASVVFIAVINGTMINVALPYIGAAFDVTEGTYGWIVTGYVLTFGVFSAINGRLADIVGRRKLYMFGLASLGLASLGVAASPTIELVIAVRVIQGIGAAALPVLGTTIVKELVTPAEQGRAVGYIMSTVGVAASIGPFLGGILVSFAGWRAVFLFTGVVLLAIPVAWRMLPRALDETSGATFDIPGAALVALGVAGLLYSFNLVEARAPLWQTFGLIGTSLALIAGFAVWIRRSSNPFVHPSVFTREYIACCIIASLTNCGRFGSVILAPIFLTLIHKLDPIMVGGALFPGALAIAFLSNKAGKWADRAGPRAPVMTGIIAMLIGGVVTAIFAGTSPLGATVGLTFFGVGFAFTQSPLVSTVNKIVPRAQGGAGVGMFMMIFFVGGGAGVALSVTMVELLPNDTQGFFDLFDPQGGQYANAILTLTALNALGLLLLPLLPRPSASLDQD